MAEPARRQTTIGVSLKMYFTHHRTLEYCEAIAGLALGSPSVGSGRAELVLMPSFVSLPGALQVLRDAPVAVGAQNLAVEDFGAFTGEVSGAVLHEIGVRHVEVGHAERRTLFGETDEIVAAKTLAALRNGLVPWLCVGERERAGVDEAVDTVVREVLSALPEASYVPAGARLIAAYEPHWAIGAAQPAPTDYVAEVCSRARQALTERVADRGIADVGIVYGGSAGPGLLSDLGTAVDGIFLGRFAHNPHAVGDIIAEAADRIGV